MIISCNTAGYPSDHFLENARTRQWATYSSAKSEDWPKPSTNHSPRVLPSGNDCSSSRHWSQGPIEISWVFPLIAWWLSILTLCGCLPESKGFPSNLVGILTMVEPPLVHSDRVPWLERMAEQLLPQHLVGKRARWNSWKWLWNTGWFLLGFLYWGMK